MTESSQRRLFCSNPFTFFEVANYPRRGDVFVCCPAWLPKSIGNLSTTPMNEIWNSESAQAIRASILDGSFRYCNEHCPHLHAATGPVQERNDVVEPTMVDIIEHERVEIASGPKDINAAFDRSCNLACPTCRTEHIIEKHAEPEILGLQQAIERQALTHANTLWITGSGDAFGSPYFFAWLRSIDLTPFPNLRLRLHTNAQLWTTQRWQKLPASVRERIVSCEISIDAASERTYLINRRGGNWNVLLENLAFVAGLRREGPLQSLKVHMVVQENNFEEMPAFVDLGRLYGADSVYFSHLVDWRTFDPTELKRRSIHLDDHPRHVELRAVLLDPRLREPIVDLGNLTPLTPSASS